MIDLAARQQEVLGQPPRIAPLKPEELNAEALEIAGRLRRAAGGGATEATPQPVSEIVATMLKHPSLYRAHIGLSTELLGHATLALRHRELAILRTAWLCAAPYEWGEHVAIGKRAGLSSEEIERITQGSGAPGWTELDRAVIRSAEELHGRAMISDGTWAVLAGALDERQLIELTYVIGNYHKIAFLQNALRMRLNAGNPGLTAR